MKELESAIQENQLQSTEIVAEQEKKKEIKLVGRQRKMRGGILWEYNQKTHEIKRAQYTKEIAKFDFDTSRANQSTPSKVNVKENCIYEQALNYKNIVKRLKKMGYTEFK